MHAYTGWRRHFKHKNDAIATATIWHSDENEATFKLRSYDGLRSVWISIFFVFFGSQRLYGISSRFHFVESISDSTARSVFPRHWQSTQPSWDGLHKLKMMWQHILIKTEHHTRHIQSHRWVGILVVSNRAIPMEI